MSAAPRGLSRPHASFIGTVCQGIHHCALHNNPTTSPNRDPWAAIANTQRKTQNCVQLEHSTIRSSHTSTTPHNRAWPTRNKRTNTHTPQQGCVQAAPATTDRCASVHSQYEHQPHPNGCGRCSRPLSSSQTTTPHHPKHPPHKGRGQDGGNGTPPPTRGLAVREPNSMHHTTVHPHHKGAGALTFSQPARDATRPGSRERKHPHIGALPCAHKTP